MDRNQSSMPPKCRQTSAQEAKRKRLVLLPGPTIAGYQIQLNEEKHAIVINGLMERYTPDEYHLLLRLMEQYEQPVSFDALIAQFQDALPTDLELLKVARRKLTCTLSDLRIKLWPTDFTIVLVVDMGYMLLHQRNLWSMKHAVPSDPKNSF